MVQPAHEEVEIVVERNGKRRTLRGVREGESPYIRLNEHFHTLHPAIKAAVRNVKDALGVRVGKRVNNVWVAVGSEESGDLVQLGQNLLANVRIEKRTGKFVVAVGVALGAIVAIEVIRRSHHEP